MTTPAPAQLVCPVCGTPNPASRQFCRTCAADLRAPVPAPGAATEPPPTEIPKRPIVIGAAVAAIALLALAGIILALGGTPSPSPTPSAPATLAPSPTPLASAAPTAPPATATALPVTPPPATASTVPLIRAFNVPETVDCSDPSFTGQITVSWRVVNATGVSISIDGPGIYQRYPETTGEAEVPFSCGQSHTYLLTTIGGNGPAATRQVTVEQSGG